MERKNTGKQLEELSQPTRVLEQPSLVVPPSTQFGTSTQFGVTMESLLELQEFIPPTANLEHAYAYDRQILLLAFNLVWRERLRAF